MKENNCSYGICFELALTMIFVILKLSNVISWSWLWVCSPLWISVCLTTFTWICMQFYLYVQTKR